MLIRVKAVTTEHQWLTDIPLEQVNDSSIEWFWVDFHHPTDEEAQVLANFFHFHPLAIEDCMHFLQRPKLDYYDNYTFFVVHSINQATLNAEELDMFVAKKYIVTFHSTHLEEVDIIWERLKENKKAAENGPYHVAYSLIDKLVDHYFPTVYKIEEELDRLEDIGQRRKSTPRFMDMVFSARSDLLQLRRTVYPMRDLLYRILNADSFKETNVQRIYLTDIYDHLLKLSETIESNREITADIRDNYLSVNTHRTNRVMMVLTVITTIFMPLTFIAGVYGMNFKYMPELNYRYGYFMVLALMAVLGLGMYYRFRKNGWFDNE